MSGKCCRTLLFVNLIMVLGCYELSGQITIAFQGFENSAADNWFFTSPFQNPNIPQVIVGPGNYGAGYAKTGIRSLRIGGGSTTCGLGSGNCVANTSPAGGGSCTNNPNGAEIIMQPVNVECFSAVTISVAHRSHILCSGQGQGFDTTDNIRMEASINGGPFTLISNYVGNNNCIWGYAVNPVLCIGNLPNPFIYNVPPGTITIAFRVSISVNRSDEVLYLDDFRLSGIPLTTSNIFHN